MAHNSLEGNRRRQRTYRERQRAASPLTPKLRVDDDGRQCTRCLEYKPWDQFPDMKTGGARGKRPRCKPCHNSDEAKRMREARQASPQRVRRMRSDAIRLYRYGVTAEQYAEAFERQGGCCAICGVHEDDLKKQLCIDHDHKTGAFRGLLCDPCNNGIGRFADDTDRLEAAVRYLKEVCHQN